MENEKNIPKPVVEESSGYDNFTNNGVFDGRPHSVFRFLDEDEVEVETDADIKEWKKHWIGMPEFKQEPNPPYKRLIVNFKTKEDYEEFAKLVDQKLTEKTKSVWHPKIDRDENSLKRWFEIED